ncbi:oligosaccharide flippase family protein, partial [bacterium]|nr:oligosaccharide flippase family protein [bacterium]
VAFLLLPLYTNVFTTEEYGIVSLAYAFTGFVMIAYRYGMDSALMKYYIEADGENKKTYFTTIFSIQTLTSLVFSLFLFLITYHMFFEYPILFFRDKTKLCFLQGL